MACARGEKHGCQLVLARRHGTGGRCMAALCPDARTRNVAAKIESSGGKAILTNKMDQGVTIVLLEI
ncbi:MAG: hypothetical protein WED04_02025 [Promethearchaeati archaeon SRVP18_Atabeyarchaeia-1]